MSNLKTIRKIEMKLESGSQRFSAQEVMTLLNEIRILKGAYSKALKEVKK